jgi:hypothetical protein
LWDQINGEDYASRWQWLPLDLTGFPKFNPILPSIGKAHGQEEGSALSCSLRGSELMAINEYRHRAVQCLCIADKNTTSAESRMLLVGMAQAWLKLAQRVEHNPSAEILWQTTSPPIAAAAQ